jgi:hypothetical protein
MQAEAKGKLGLSSASSKKKKELWRKKMTKKKWCR